MISFGEDKHKPALKEMWKLCFPADTGAFIDFYFDEVYKNDETLIYLENGKPAAAFQMIPYTLKNGEEISPAGYISGAMTHPDFRRKGLMKELLLASFDVMREKGFDYTFLIPQETWLFDFYAKFGYKTFESLPLRMNHDKNQQLTDNQNNICKYITGQARNDKAIYLIYSRFLSEIPQVVLKTEKQFRQILRDFYDGNGVLFANEQGVAFTFQEENQIVIKEFFYRNPKIRDLFLKVIRDYYSQEEIRIFNSPDSQSTGLRGMIKRLNDEKSEILALYISMMLEG